MRRIAVLIHPSATFDRGNYVLHRLSQYWVEDGIEVRVLRGIEPGAEADLCVMHVDLTVVPDDLLEFAKGFPSSVNAEVADISKRRISGQLVGPEDGYTGPVILKDDRNWGGKMESLMAQKGLLPEDHKWILPRYMVFDDVRQVPSEAWVNPRVVVERFLPERRGEFYCLRMWKFLGDREANTLCLSREPVVKSGNIVHREAAGEVPEDLRRMRRDLKFDFGKFDYVMREGRAVLYDANRTPSAGVLPPDYDRAGDRRLAEGIRSFLE